LAILDDKKGGNWAIPGQGFLNRVRAYCQDDKDDPASQEQQDQN
jgi:hypothetical protein